MKLSEFKSHLHKLEVLSFKLPNGEWVPAHFHVTEVGSVVKHFIDCGGTVRMERRVNFQLWEANDYHHRLHPGKLMSIIELSERVLGLSDEEIEVEYQGETIGKYGMEVVDNQFRLTSLTTDCLARDKCGIPEGKQKLSMSSLVSEGNRGCAPGSGCC